MEHNPSSSDTCMSFFPPQVLEALVPAARAWLEHQESLALEIGRPLSTEELAMAEVIGLRHPTRVRVAEVDAVPWPDNVALENGAATLGLRTENREGLCCRYGIFLKQGLADPAWRLAHELTHTTQIERLGDWAAFLRRYTQDRSLLPREECALEIEAIAMADKVTKSLTGSVAEAA